MSQDSTVRSCAQSVVEGLKRHGIDTLFCVPGVQNDHLFNALYDARNSIHCIHTRHEQGAAYMALGAAMATGKPAAYSVVPGPGILNTTAALSTAWAVNAPVLALTGQIPQRLIGRGLGMLHELPDQLGVLQSLTKWAQRIEGPHHAGTLVDEAFRQLTTGRPRPVALECAIDVWARKGVPEVLAATPQQAPGPDPQLLDRAADLVLKAKNPLIVVGGGALEVGPLVRRIAEALQAPVVSARLGRGVLDARHPLAVIPPVAHRMWPQVDVVLAIGTRLQTQHMVWGMDANVKVVRIDADAAEIERWAPPEVGVCASAETALPGLLERIAAGAGRRADRGAEIAAHRAAIAGQTAFLAPQRAYIQAIRAALPEDGIFVEDMTQIGYASRIDYPVYKPRTYLSTGFQGTLGWGYATALGAKVARPDVPVVSVNGDGGFMFNVQELATAVQHRIGVVAIVFDDGAYGNVKRMQQMQFGDRPMVCDLRNPDFVKMAESFGADAYRANDADELRTALDKAIAKDVPALIHAPIGEMPDPWKFLNLPRVRG